MATSWPPAVTSSDVLLRSDRTAGAGIADPRAVEHTRGLSPFGRRVARRLSRGLAAGRLPREAIGLVVSDSTARQAAIVSVGRAAIVVSDPIPVAGAQVLRWVPDVALDLIQGCGTTVTVAGTPGDRLAQALLRPTLPRWQGSAPGFWDRHGHLPGMPGQLSFVCSDDGERLDFGTAGGSRFQVHATRSVLDRLLCGDILFGEALFSHQLRIDGPLAAVSVLIRATMREAFDD
jgi:hypothetical protein